MTTPPTPKGEAQRELVLGCVSLAIAAGYYTLSTRIQHSDISDVVGPQGLPTTYAVLLAALSVVLIIRALLSRRAAATSPPEAPPRMTPPSGTAKAAAPTHIGWRVFGMVMNGVIYILVVPWLGYILSIAALIGATVFYQGGGMNRRVAAVAIGGALLFWLLFVRLLHIAHPPGIWG
jgi:hypothetical protein